MAGIAQEGAALWYRRMPLSRNRTPSHQDLSELHEGAFCADGSTDNVNYVIIARAASSSTSACFAAHFLCTALDAVQEWEGRRSSEGGGMTTGVKAARMDSGSMHHETLDISVIDNLCRCGCRSPGAAPLEYRSTANCCSSWTQLLGVGGIFLGCLGTATIATALQ